MRVLVLGGDGFCGWPTSLYLSERGHDVTIVDNLSRRKIDVDLEVQSLTPIRPIGERIRVWGEVSGREIGFVQLDLAEEYDRLAALLADLRPDAIVHFAEQRAAPYSMRNAATKRYTVDNNVRATHNLLTALVDTGVDAALAHLGTMGVYGYGWSGSAPIPEGYLTVKVETPDGELEREILHPANPGSVYHMTKTLDQLLFAFYAKNDGLRITDLHQGIVWGTQTDQTSQDERLINRFDYDGDYGTVLNRFLMQAAIGHPLTVHGTGGQTRAFIHIRDTVRCIELAITSPPESGDRVRVLNQITETHQVLELAKLVADTMGVDIAYLPNPRREADENDLVVRNDQFIALGLKPTTLSEGLLGEGTDIASKYKDRADTTKIMARSVWRAGMETSEDLITELPAEK
ncbi:MAG TPA: NAD-dependent epimerase/dehydratase family protein [Streptosporangiaceae bacterium]|nr:NAD-dependent epimerase/dehydratase family protein [Streptosporangiaceae bacterium]